MPKYVFHVSGTHCPSCKILIEDILSQEQGVLGVQVDLKKRTVTLETSFEEEESTLVVRLSEKIQANGYRLSCERPVSKKNFWKGFWPALLLGLLLLVVFFWVQKSGILNFGFGGKTSPVTSFLIGLVASVSSCLAVVGGLVLSLSATVSLDKVSDTRPMVLFHVGRLLGFVVLGGALGLVGSVIGISFTGSAILGLLVSVVMILLGLNLVGVFEKKMIVLPSGVFSFFRKVESIQTAPFLLGVSTFFLPCGFTQAMQVAALSSGSFVSGSIIMGAFVLGTFPMLALLSFGSASVAQSKHALLFFRVAGVVVVGLGIFALLSGLAGLGVIPPLFSL